MTFLLDTNVISEGFRRFPDHNVIDWLDEVPEESTFISAVTVGEVRKGIEKLPLGRRRRNLEVWLVESLVPRFEGRILAVDAAVADLWGRTLAACQANGRPVDPIDTQIGATALCYELTLATRNLADFAPMGVELFNPWGVEA
ncbi:type II toxin-antitoxin system VapC family toxin [Jiangella aurantiaca]|uniref:Ribonuclease VapC n=1 Tax=Jiangella aurantiaca TaxID=2530373 RepID=A0A4R5A3S8_9ACTN|nr:type II toxin-antitoxin system VapC family toxin [Jiangella aurantiaca]TDD64152.1 type II toxin-antitoxin system VapC family toxin [Jiangella aurantiaca]